MIEAAYPEVVDSGTEYGYQVIGTIPGFVSHCIIGLK